MDVEGLPEGIASARWGTLVANPDNKDSYVLLGDGSLQKNGRGLVVTLKPDWTAVWRPEYGDFIPEKRIDATVVVTFRPGSETGLRRLREHFRACPNCIMCESSTEEVKPE